MSFKITVDQTKLQAKAAKERIAELKQLLRDTDFVALPDYDKDKPDVLAQRQAWRDEIRELEAKTWDN
jgi:NAD(P)H-dependent FMN reductase